MTVMVAEQAGKKAAQKTAGKKVAQGKVTQSSYQTYNTRTRQRPAQAAQPRPGRAQQARNTADDVTRARNAYGRQGQYIGQNARVFPGDRGYQPVILAEFLAAVVIVTLTPIATGGSPAAQAKNSPSPYDTGDLRQLVAIGGVYFVLALLSSGNSGRLAAWFGGLVLIALGMSKVAHGQLTAAFHTVSGDTAVKEAGEDPFANPA
jgi:hypothetical protein